MMWMWYVFFSLFTLFDICFTIWLICDMWSVKSLHRLFVVYLSTYVSLARQFILPRCKCSIFVSRSMFLYQFVALAFVSDLFSSPQLTIHFKSHEIFRTQGISLEISFNERRPNWTMWDIWCEHYLMWSARIAFQKLVNWREMHLACIQSLWWSRLRAK